MRKVYRFPCLAGLHLLFILSIKAQYAIPYPFDGVRQSPAHQHYQYLCDSANNLSPEQAHIQFLQGKGLTWNKGATFNPGFTKYRYWFFLPIKNITATTQNPCLVIASVVYNLQIIDVTHSPSTEIFKGSTSIPYNKRPFRHREFVLPLSLAGGDSMHLLLCADYRNRNMRLNVNWLSVQELFYRETSFSKKFGVYLGIMLFILVFNLFLFLSLRDRIHLWYTVYLVTIILYAVFDYKMDSLLFPNTATLFSDSIGGLPFDELMVAAALKFMQVFIRQDKNSKLYYLVVFFIYSALAIAITYFIIGFVNPQWLTAMPEHIQPIFSYHTMAGALLIPISCLKGTLNRQSESIMYLLSSSMPVIGGLIYFLNQMGIIINNDYAKDGIVIGITLEIAILSIYLVQRYNQLKKDKEKLLLDLNKKDKEIINSIITTMENERKRIAQDLHDDVGATLGALKLHISNLPENHSSLSFIDNYYQKAIFLTTKAVDDIRNISHDLIPQDFSENGLFQTLAFSINAVDTSANIRIGLITHGNDRKLTTLQSINTYRIVKELINNMIRHSKADEAEIQVIIDDSEALVIAEDNGIGMNEQAVNDGIGLRNVLSRINYLKGQLRVDNRRNGTTIIITIPLDESIENSNI
jgi:signal transduction histidine kinase